MTHFIRGNRKATAAGDIVEIIVGMPDDTHLGVSVECNATANDVYGAFARRAGMEGADHFFFLFEISPGGFARKLLNSEIVYDIYQRREQGARTNLCVRKWIFTKRQEIFASGNATAIGILAYQARKELESGHLAATTDERSKLDELWNGEGKIAFLASARKLARYSTIQFPPCDCDGYSGKVILSVSLSGIQMAKALPTGQAGKSREFRWQVIKRWACDTDSGEFKLEHGEGEGGWVALASEYAVFMAECVGRVVTELT
eukprot:Opistho-2@10168